MAKDVVVLDKVVRVNLNIRVPRLPEERVLSLRTAIKELVAEYPEARVDVSVSDVFPTSPKYG